MVDLLEKIIDRQRHPLDSEKFRADCQRTLAEKGVLVLPGFLTSSAISAIRCEGEQKQEQAYFTANSHNIYLTSADPVYPPDHPRNREVTSSKGCITTDQISAESPLRILYDAAVFRDFLCAVLDEKALHEYADSMSSINLHFANEGQELGWHFDNSSFAITLMIQRPEEGGAFGFVKDVRDADSGEMNYALAGKILDGEVPINNLTMEEGALVLFRGRNSMHHVTPVRGSRTRMLAVLAYNTKPGISLSAPARETFYGRLN